jgi:hypothetical protein
MNVFTFTNYLFYIVNVIYFIILLVHSFYRRLIVMTIITSGEYEGQKNELFPLISIKFFYSPMSHISHFYLLA